MILLIFLRSPQAGLAKSLDQYWSDAGLTESDLLEQVNDIECHLSEKSFLGCINAVGAMADKLGVSHTEVGLLQGGNGSIKRVTEKQFLSRYSVYFQKYGSQQFQFQKIVSRLMAVAKKEANLSTSLLVATGINARLSVIEDPHTYLVPSEYYKEVIAKSDQRSLSLGLILGISKEKVLIKKVFEGSLAAEAGLRLGDELIKVDGKELQGLSWISTNEILKGSEGQKLRLLVRRQGKIQEIEFTRQVHEIPTVSWKTINGIKRVGVLSINKFSTGVCDRVALALQSLQADSVKGILLDLRDNSGGQIEEAACVVGKFAGPKERVFTLRYFDSTHEEIYGTEEQQVSDMPLAVLINAGSASASEIVAGAIQDFKRGLVVGERSFGKGSFQEGQIWPRNGKVAKFKTMGFFELPSGRSPQIVGIEPDVKIDFGWDEARREEDLYWSPKMIPMQIPGEGTMALQMENCLDPSDFDESHSEVSNDLQLAKAKAALLCATQMAKGG